MKPKILITPQAFNILDDTIEEVLGTKFHINRTGSQLANKKELIYHLKHYDGCIIGSEIVDEEVFNACPRLKILSRFGSGYNSIDIEQAKRYKVAVTIVPNTNPKVVARHAMALLLALTNNIIIQNENIKNGVWDKSYNISPEKSKIGIIGLGKIGFEFSLLCKDLGFDIHYFSRSNKKIKDYKYYSSIKSLVNQCDILSLHLECNTQTISIIDSEIIELMAGKYFINTARGKLLDEASLYKNLKNRNIIGAGIDVFINEPLNGISKKLAQLDNVISTAHISCYDYSSIENVGRLSLQNIKFYFFGPTDKVDKLLD